MVVSACNPTNNGGSTSSPASAVFIFYIYCISTALLPSHFPSSLDPLFLCFSFLKKAGLPGISTEYAITYYIKTRNKPSYQGWMRQPRRNKRMSSTGKRVRDTLYSCLLRVPWEQHAKKPWYICKQPSSNPYKVCDCFFFQSLWIYDPLVVSVGHDFIASSISSAPNPRTTFWEVLALPHVWLWVSASATISCLSDNNWAKHKSMSIAEYH